MSKFVGTIGFSSTSESLTHPGVWEQTVVERTYCGDLIKDARRWEKGFSINDDLTIGNRISFVADEFATQNCQTMKYVKFCGVAWKIVDVDKEYPRLILTLGGVYDGKQA